MRCAAQQVRAFRSAGSGRRDHRVTIQAERHPVGNVGLGIARGAAFGVVFGAAVDVRRRNLTAATGVVSSTAGVLGHVARATRPLCARDTSGRCSRATGPSPLLRFCAR
jgi:hypothetical protein